MSIIEGIPAATLVMGSWSSSCNNCGRGTLWTKAHDQISGYGEGGPGCGIEFTHVICEYGKVHHHIAERDLPHLELIEEWPRSA